MEDINMGFKIGIVGTGSFARGFVPLFKNHPFTDEVVLADLIKERVEKMAEDFQIKRYVYSLDEMLKTNVDAVAIFTQRHLHGEQVKRALQAGKHVYCAVPMAQTQDEVFEILELVRRTGLIYMTGETSYYYPSAVFCRDRFKAGAFGHFVYGEARYFHDMSHGFYDAFRRSGGADWKRVAGIPPMHYPTHSISLVLSVTGAKALKVSCLGYIDRHMDGIFRKGGNLWDNPFSNETALFRTSDGGMMRINEFRRIGWSGKVGEDVSLFGTLGSFEENALTSVWTTLDRNDIEDVTPLLTCRHDPSPAVQGEHSTIARDFHSSVAKVHHTYRLPDSFKGLPNGHYGSHQFLVDDFMKALATNQLPPNHAWRAAEYILPGLVAHQSALRDGELMSIPDVGEVPSDRTILDPDSFIAYRF
jgi:predicted dehydrogenase